jgi:hypothetical protein
MAAADANDGLEREWTEHHLRRPDRSNGMNLTTLPGEGAGFESGIPLQNSSREPVSP